MCAYECVYVHVFCIYDCVCSMCMYMYVVCGYARDMIIVQKVHILKHINTLAPLHSARQATFLSPIPSLVTLSRGSQQSSITSSKYLGKGLEEG